MTWRYVGAPDVRVPLPLRILGLWRHRRLLRRMAERDLRQRYVGTAGGVAWAAVYPLLLVTFYTAIFTFVFRGRLSPGAPPAEYALYVVSGLLPWISFADVAGRATQVMAEHRGLAKFAMFPVQVLPLTSLYTTAFSLGVGLLALIVFAASSHGISAGILLLLPAVVLQTLFLAGIAWLLGALGALIRDVRELVSIALLVGMFLTPIFYAESDAPRVLRPLVALNPLAHLIRLYRTALLGGGGPDTLVSLLVFGAVAVVTPLVGYRVFERTRALLGDVL
ncbi:MAG TPA: ABC transporter permease [Chloroflexota bacterium]|nr:ABC transporter permease [Chloroflexota bacterium]